MTSPDPFAHGTPVGDSHTWVSADQMDCPNCPCCVVRLCRQAAEMGVPCSGHPSLARGDGYMSVVGCPCTATMRPAGYGGKSE